MWNRTFFIADKVKAKAATVNIFDFYLFLKGPRRNERMFFFKSIFPLKLKTNNGFGKRRKIR